jgi:hypothetical protein
MIIRARDLNPQREGLILEEDKQLWCRIAGINDERQRLSIQ